MSDRKNNKKKLLWIALGALGLAIAGTATGVAISKNTNKKSSKDKKALLKEILQDKNLIIPDKMKQYLQELLQSEVLDDSLNIGDIKSSLVNWTVIEKYLKTLSSEQTDIKFMSFLEKSMLVKLADVKDEKNNIELRLDQKNYDSIKELSVKKDQIKKIEKNLGKFVNGILNSEESFNEIEKILSKTPPIVSDDGIEMYNKFMQKDFNDNNNLKESLKNIIDIDSKARELIKIAKEIKIKSNKNEKEQAALVKYDNYFNASDQIEEDKFLENSLLNDFVELIKEFNSISETEDDNDTASPYKTIEQEKLEAKSFINSLQNLSNNLKIKYVDKIDSLSTSASIEELKNRSNAYNEVVKEINNIINESEKTKETAKYKSATNQNDFNAKLQEVKELLVEEKLKAIDVYVELDSKIEDLKILINELSNLKDELNGNSSSDELQSFRNDVEAKLTSSISEKVQNYSLENLIYSTTITKENKALFIEENEIDGVELTFKDVFLTDNNVNELNLVYKAKSKINSNLVTDVVEKIVFSNDFGKKINALSFDNIDQLYDFSYEKLSTYYQSDLTTKQEEIKSLFKKKLNSVNGFFNYDLALENILYENNKVALQVNFIVNKKVMKKIKLLTSKNVSFKDDFWKGIIIEPSDSFKNSEYYNNPDSAWSGDEKLSIYYKQLIVFNTWFVHDVLNPAKNTFSDLVNRNVSSQIHSLNYKPQKGTDDLTLEELNKVFSKIQTDKTYWSKMFNITMPEGVSYEWVNSSSSNKFTPSGNNASFKFRVTRDGVSKELELNLKIKKDDDSNQDVKDLNKIRELIEIDNDPKNPLKSSEKILELIKVKEKGKTHNQVNSKDAIEAFNNLYSLPKIGKYEIYAKELIEYKNIVNSNVGGTAKIFFWIKENGVPIQHRNITTTLTESAYKDKYSKTIHYFKPLSYRDLKPKNGKEWFDSSDFLETSEISVEDKNLINSINSSNFEYRRVDGSISRNNNKQFALVDPKDIVEQKAFDMLNYVLKLNAAVDREENNTSGFTNEKPGATADDKPINSSTSNIDWYTSENNIKNTNDTPNNQNLSSIANNYFMYFYDVTSDSDMSLSFKLGFINKQDNNKRYTSGNVITLINLKNDYKQNLYPELLLNRIKLSDFTFNPGSMSANDFQNKVKTGSNDVNRMFTWQNDALSYNNFKLDPTRIQVAESKKIEANNGINSIYVKFKYTNPISNKTFVGNNWYKISGFTSANPLSGDDEFTFANQNLKTILHSTTHITRERILEPYYKDLLWSFNTKQEKAYWILKDKYLEHTLLKSGASNRKLKINLFGNQLIQDARRLARISDLDKNYSFEFDFEKLISGQTLFYKQQTRTYNRESDSSEYPKISFIIKASYIVGEGVKFELELENKEYKLFLGNPYAEAITSKELNGPRYGEFLKEKAFLLSYAGAQVSVIYDNSLQHEEFGQKTNQFSYKHLDYNQENQPITFYTPEEVINSGMYNPNQNVSYELHNGYLQDQEYIHSSWKNIELVNNVRARSFAFSQGTATQFAKVNNDPNDYKYYIITNNHVEHISNISEVQGDKLAKKETRRYITKTSNNFGNDVDAGFSYWGGLNTANRIPIEVLWSGVDQINKNGIHSPGLSVDITVFAVDVKELIENAQKSGKFDLKEWFENWSTLNNTNLDFSGVKKGVYFGQNLKRFGMSGFPYGKQSGYFLNRASSSASAVGLIRQNGYAPTFYNAGNSGTGVLGENNEYISTINSGAPLTFLQSWNNENTTMNYFGINYDNEHPLDLKNTNSLAAQIIRWHLTKPSEVSMPWFLRDIKKEK